MTDFPDRDRSQNYYERNISYSRDRLYSRDRMYDRDRSYSTIKMTIEVTIEMTTEMIIEMTIEKKIIGISKTRDIRENIKIIIKTHMTRITIELATETRIGAKIDTKTKTDTEMTAMTKLEVGLKKKITYVMMMIYLTQKLKECTKFYKQ